MNDLFNVGWAVKMTDGVIYLSTVRTEKEDSIAALLKLWGYASNDLMTSLHLYKKPFIDGSEEKTWQHLKVKWHLECVPVEIREIEEDEIN